MISLTNRAVSALYSILPQLKANKRDRMSKYVDAPFAVVRYVEKGIENKDYAPFMGNPKGVRQGIFLLRSIKSLSGSASSQSYYICKISDVIAVVPSLQRMCNILLDKYYSSYLVAAKIDNLARLKTINASYITFDDFAYLVSLLDLLLEFAPIHYRTRDDYYRADNRKGDRLLGSPLEQLLIMEREGGDMNKYDTVFSRNCLQSSLCVRHRQKMSYVSWNGYTQPMKLPIINEFYWDMHGFALGMLASRILMLAGLKGGNPVWSAGSFYYGMGRITGDAPFNTTSCPMMNKELKTCNAVDEATFTRMRRALVLLSALSFNANFYLSANYGTPPETLEAQYIHRSCPSKGCFVRMNNYYVQIPSFVVDSSSSSYTKDLDCSFSQSPIPRFYSGNGNLAKSEKGYGCYAKNEAAGAQFGGHREFKRAYNSLLRNSGAKPIVEAFTKANWSRATQMQDSAFALVVNGVECKWPNEVAKTMAFLFANNIADKRLDNEFYQKQALMTVRCACDSPANTFGGLIMTLFLQWHSALMRFFSEKFPDAVDRLNFDPKFSVCTLFSESPDLNSALVREDYFKAVARDAIQLMGLTEDVYAVSDMLQSSTFPSSVFAPGSVIADASVVYGDVSITDPDLLSYLPSRPGYVSIEQDTNLLPESIRIPGAYDYFEQDVEDGVAAVSSADVKRGRTIMLDRLNWRVIFDKSNI